MGESPILFICLVPEAGYPPHPMSHYFPPRVLNQSSVVSESSWPHGLWPPRLLCPWRFPRQEYWSGLPVPSPGDLPDPGIEAGSPALQADALPLSRQGAIPPYSKTTGSDHVIRLHLTQHGVRAATGGRGLQGRRQDFQAQQPLSPSGLSDMWSPQTFQKREASGPHLLALTQPSGVNRSKAIPQTAQGGSLHPVQLPLMPGIFQEYTLSFKKMYHIQVWLIYNVVLISALRQSDVVILTFFFMFFSIVVYHSTLTMVPYTRQQDVVFYPFCIEQFASPNPKLLIHPSPTCFPVGSHKCILYVCDSLSVLQISSFVSYFRFHI